jgi:predicted phage terminase large subunit-like protein
VSAALDYIIPEDRETAYRDYLALEGEFLSRHFYDFVKEAWPIVEPGAPFVDAWHIDAICEHLTYCSLGDIDELVINIPPRHTKSITVAVMWPAWEWTWLPSSQWLFATYAQQLTIRDSIKCRRLIQSPWYQARWGHRFKLSGDLNQKMRFDNTANGYRLATSVGGTATGEGGDRIVIDDAHNMKEIHSDLVREGVIDWWRNVMSTRANNPKKACKVIIAQRGHHRDLPGYVVSTGKAVHLNLPGYYIPQKKCITRAMKDSPRLETGTPEHYPQLPPLVKDQVIFRDPREIDGELLNPERFGEKEMQSLADALTDRAFEAQIQQNPSMDEGNILKRKHWRKWEDAELPPCIALIQVYDTAFEEEEENDYSARTTWGVFEWEEDYSPPEGAQWKAARKGQRRLCLILLERWKDRVQFPELRAEAMESAKQWKPDRILIEKKSSGHALAQEMRRADLPIARVRVQDSKWARAHAAALVFERGCVFYVPRNWAEEVIQECAEFPAGEHDDIVDTVTLACLWLRRKHSAQFLDDESDDDIDYMASIFRAESRKPIYG